ncbi:MAG TPA: hypothetical protein VGI60_12570 [Chthoniobacterales bacterium]
MRKWATGALTLHLLIGAQMFAAVPVSCWDAASEFNDSANPDAANPSGVWSYGWKKTLIDKFFLATTPYTDPPTCFGWCNASGYPKIIHTTRPVSVLMNGPNPAVFPPHVLCLHPGMDGEYAVLRFTAPTDGAYRVSGQFFALDDNATGTSTDVCIVPNDNKTGAFSGKVDYKGGVRFASFTSREFQLKKGNTLDFEVGYGAAKNYFYDSTGLVALIEKIK